MQQGTIGRSFVEGIAHASIASAVGLFGLSALFGSLTDQGGLRAWLWLALAVAVCLWLVIPAAAIARVLGHVLERVPGHTATDVVRRHIGVDVARLLTAVVYLVLFQAIMRRPLVSAVGPEAEPFVVEATFGVLALLVLLTILAWVHRTARPLVEGLARFTLDTAVATSGSEAAAAQSRAFDADSRARAHATRLQTASDATLPAHTVVGEETVVTRKRPRSPERD